MSTSFCNYNVHIYLYVRNIRSVRWLMNNIASYLRTFTYIRNSSAAARSNVRESIAKVGRLEKGTMIAREKRCHSLGRQGTRFASLWRVLRPWREKEGSKKGKEIENEITRWNSKLIIGRSLKVFNDVAFDRYIRTAGYTSAVAGPRGTFVPLGEQLLKNR